MSVSNHRLIASYKRYMNGTPLSLASPATSKGIVTDSPYDVPYDQRIWPADTYPSSKEEFTPIG